jgi:hypothetical protein
MKMAGIEKEDRFGTCLQGLRLRAILLLGNT